MKKLLIIISTLTFLTLGGNVFAAEWIVGSGGDSTWNAGTFDNTTEDKGDGNLKLGVLRDNFDDLDEDLTCTGATKGVTDRGTFYFNVTAVNHYCYYADTNFTGLYLYADITPIASTKAASTQHAGLTMRYMNQTSTYNDVARKKNGVRLYINIFGPSSTSGFTFGNTYNMWFWFNESANTNLTARWSGAEGDWTISNASYRPSESGYIGFRLDKLDAEWDNFMALSVDNNGNPKLDGNYTTATRDSGSGNEPIDIKLLFTDYDQTESKVSIYIDKNDGVFTLVKEGASNNTAYSIASGDRNQNYKVRLEFVTNDVGYTPELGSITVTEISVTGADTTPPVISNVQSTPDTISSVVTWDTNENANSSISLNDTATYSNSSSYTTSHSITITGILESTGYSYNVHSCDSSGNCASNGSYQFTTSSTSPVCGNGVCETGEDSGSCPSDCPIPPACGDGTCDSGEDCSSCSTDCGTCPEGQYPTNPMISIMNRIWEYIGIFTEGDTVDFKSELQDYMDVCTADPCLVPLNITSESEGNLEISNIYIEYD